ncbi:hypothetical protein ACH427_30010 [Streptomyces sp. NPDC020379]|uniref:hypothetical protein n=1 Tax=Streptomyces sp. NPDC020379 TaxID=3365071 RepID=UPI0037ABB073
MRNIARGVRLGALAVSGAAALALTVTACDSGGSSSYDGSGKSAPSPSGQQPQPAPAATALVRTRDARLGAIVTDAKGFTLYRFDKDKPKPSVSNCSGNCATTWPPAAAGDQVTLKGIDKALVSTVTRADGSKQLTLGGWPLYRYAPDTKPGDTKGQGIAGTWFASDPQGRKAQAGTGGGGGYGY